MLYKRYDMTVTLMGHTVEEIVSYKNVTELKVNKDESLIIVLNEGKIIVDKINYGKLMVEKT
jgi:hypothetical protein